MNETTLSITKKLPRIWSAWFIICASTIGMRRGPAHRALFVF